MQKKKKFFFKKEEVELKDLLNKSEMDKITGGLESYTKFPKDDPLRPTTYTESTYYRF